MDKKIPVISSKEYSFFRLLFKEAEDKKSPLSGYLNKLAFKFILENLDPPNREIFLEKLDYGSKKALAFAEEKIRDFDKKLSLVLQSNLQRIQSEVI